MTQVCLLVGGLQDRKQACSSSHKAKKRKSRTNVHGPGKVERAGVCAVSAGAWHVNTLFPRSFLLPPLLQRLSSILALCLSIPLRRRPGKQPRRVPVHTKKEVMHVSVACVVRVWFVFLVLLLLLFLPVPQDVASRSSPGFQTRRSSSKIPERRTLRTHTAAQVPTCLPRPSHSKIDTGGLLFNLVPLWLCHLASSSSSGSQLQVS